MSGTWADAGVPGVLDPADVEARLNGTRARASERPAPAAPPAPAPDADDPRPADEIEPEAAAAKAEVDALSAASVELAARIEGLERDVEAARAAAPTSAAATRTARSELAALRIELAEVDELHDRADERASRIHRRWWRAVQRERAASLLGQLADLAVKREQHLAELAAAFDAVDVAWAAVEGIQDQARAAQAGLDALPADLAPGRPGRVLDDGTIVVQPGRIPAGFAVPVDWAGVMSMIRMRPRTGAAREG